MKSKRIIVGISGGVDSAVAAYLLKEAGHNVSGIFMKNWEGDDNAAACPAAVDLADAQAVCDRLAIPLQLVNFADQYWERVFTYFLDEYRAGRTPNPDILCNKEIKFRAFLDYAKAQGADYIATGHYVQTKQTGAHTYLCKGQDALKDQSYFLHALTEEQLAQSLFPVGNLEKTAVREMAKKLNLPNHAKKDSTGICFIGEKRFKQFLNDFLPATPGVIETDRGEVIGRHDGLMFYTIGQRQGLQIGGLRDKGGEPWYVAAKDMARNVLIVVQGEDPSLYKTALVAKAIHWINAAPSIWPLQAMAKTRYRQVDQDCHVTLLANGHYRIEFEQPQRAITPGQFIVFYREDICLGGGIIEI